MARAERLRPPTPALLVDAVQTDLLPPPEAPASASTKAGLSREARNREKFLRRCRVANIPMPQTEYRFAAPDRQWRLDFAWPQYRVALESDGGTFIGGRHTTGQGHAADVEKRNEATLRHWMVLNVISSRLDRDETIQMLRRAFQAALSPVTPHQLPSR